MCVCALHCAQLLHTILHKTPDNFPSYSPDNHHCSDDVYLRKGGVTNYNYYYYHFTAIIQDNLHYPAQLGQ